MYSKNIYSLIVTDLACVQAQPISNNKDNKEFNLTCRNIAMFLDFSVDSSPRTCIYALKKVYIYTEHMYRLLN